MTAPNTNNAQPRSYRVITDSEALFWILHGLGWTGIVIITYMSLSLPYLQFELSYLAHNVSQSVLGMLISLPMRYIFRGVWGWRIWPRIAAVMASVLVLSSVWAVVRLLLFMLMTTERGLWSDFGGWLFPSIFVFLTWAALYHVVKYYQLWQREQETLLRMESQRRHEALKLARAESAAHDAQLKLLRYQLNPHFLFNTLNSVAALIDAGRSADANKMLQQLGRFLRFSLDSDRATTVSLNDEVAAVALYLKIEQVRFADRIKIEVDIDPAAAEDPVPSLLLQPLVENAIKHAIARSESGGVIRIAATRSGAQLHITIEDSGPGASDHRANGHQTSGHQANGTPREQGIGLRNTRARLTNLYGARFTLQTGASALGGFKVAIALPAGGMKAHAA